MQSNARREWMTPREVANVLRCSPEKIIRLVQSGDLSGVDLKENRCGRKSRYLISEGSLADFLDRRVVMAAPKTARRKRRKPAAIIEFF
jgi:excisionase family DNA binding protein